MVLSSEYTKSAVGANISWRLVLTITNYSVPRYSGREKRTSQLLLCLTLFTRSGVFGIFSFFPS